MYKGYLIAADGEVITANVRLEVRDENGVEAVFINGVSPKELNCDFGAGIDFCIETKGYVADFRHTPFWCMPAFGEDLKTVPDETQGLIYKKTGGGFGVILPVVGKEYKCVLKGNDQGGGLTARIFSRYKMNRCKTLAFVRAEGENPFSLLEKCAAAAARLLGSGLRLRSERSYPEVFEYLGWCSWDAMEIRVNEADLLEKCAEFREKGIPVRWAIIDDMWAEVRDFYSAEYKNRPEMFSLMHSSSLYSFKADPKRFPNGLKACIDKMKEYGMKVGMWHPTTGYWTGIDPDGEIYKDHKNDLIRVGGRYVPTCELSGAFRFYNAFHSYLRESGADFVKVDNQSGIMPYYAGLAPVGKAAGEYHAALEASVGLHFGGAMINCMGMASEDMYSRSVSAVSRCSDDFLPEDSAWFTKHIMQCAYNDLIQGQFYVCDHDMWWTDDSQAVKNSVLRAVSGGPIYVSDKIGRSNRSVLMPLILSDGKILRCDGCAVPTADCLTENPLSSGRPFKVQNTAGNACGVNGVIAAFNISESGGRVSGSVSPDEVYGISGESFAVYEHFSGEMHILKRNEKLDFALNSADEFKLFIIVPLINGFGVIGRTDKFISPKTVKAVIGKEVQLHESGEYAVVEGGELKIIKG